VRRCEVGFTIFLKPLDWVRVLHENGKVGERNRHIFPSCNMMFHYTKEKEEEARSFCETSDNEKGIVGKPRAEFFML
jgi:hypothetical protein